MKMKLFILCLFVFFMTSCGNKAQQTENVESISVDSIEGASETTISKGTVNTE